MYHGRRVIGLVPVFDEERKIGSVVERVPKDVVDEVVVIDDGSTDGSAAVARSLGATVVPLGRTLGVGAALRAGYEHAVEHGFDIAVVMAGNNKDAPEEIPRLLDPIVEGRADFVQGSRWRNAERNFGEMPRYRKIATRLHPLLFSAVARRRITDSTNGFRAVKVAVLRDPRIDLTPSWLDGYELEPYLFLRVIRLGYPVAEVPVTKVYPPKQLGQTKMRPVVDWWSILRPLFYAATGMRPRRN
ncbi:MAG: glycosyltransferase family 2 protein [Actinobacteria bacterium]|nr:glycosyltransferase family 2 protein [Actinomycetota bacterium]